MINTVPVNVQLPPGHLELLKVGAHHTSEVQNEMSAVEESWDLEQAEIDDDDDTANNTVNGGGADERLEDELRFGWKIAPLRPWKTLVLLDKWVKPTDMVVAGSRMTSGNPMLNPTEALPRFLAAASPTMTYDFICSAFLYTELIYRRQPRCHSTDDEGRPGGRTLFSGAIAGV